MQILPQLNEMVNFARPDNAVRNLKRLLGKESSPVQLKTELNSKLSEYRSL